MVIKGHARFELTNKETGEKRVIEEDNIVTNGISKVLQYVPTENHPPISKLLMSSLDSSNGNIGLKRSAKMLTGGLILLDTAMNEDVENYLPVEGISTVGCASDIAYTGSNTMAGSYNDSESGAIENGYKHVWDFGTSQANGKIACACLTTREGGFIGTGTYPFDANFLFHSSRGLTSSPDDDDILSCRYDFVLALADEEVSKGPSIYRTPLYADYNKGQIICFSNYLDFYYASSSFDNSNPSTNFMRSFIYKKSLDLTIKRLPLKDFSIFDKNYQITGNVDQTENNGYGTTVIDKVTVQMPDSLSQVIDTYSTKKGYFCIDYSCDKGFIYIVIYKNMSITSGEYFIAINDTFHVWKINVDDFSSEHIVVKNTSGKKLRIRYDSSSSINRGYIVVTNEYILTSSYDDGKIYKIDLNDATNISQITFPDGTPFVFDSISTNNIFRPAYCINKKLYVSKNNMSYVIDLRSGIAMYRSQLYILETSKISEATERPVDMVYVQGSGGFVLISVSKSNTSTRLNYMGLKLLPEIFLTINNLSSPVTKTSAETMKVTYTLTME